VESGYDPGDVKILKRWDRVGMVRELANQAKEAGTAKGLHK